jgi:hypothetical protein
MSKLDKLLFIETKTYSSKVISHKNHLTLIRSERKELVITSKGVMLVRHTLKCMANVKLSIMCFMAQSHIDGPDYFGSIKKMGIYYQGLHISKSARRKVSKSRKTLRNGTNTHAQTPKFLTIQKKRGRQSILPPIRWVALNNLCYT